MSRKSETGEASSIRGKSKRPWRRNVTFELPTHEYRALMDDAGKRGLDSIHQRGREIVVDYLSQQTAEELAEQIASLEQEIAALKEEVRYIGKLLRRLAYVTVAVSHEHASDAERKQRSQEGNRWVKENMPPMNPQEER